MSLVITAKDTSAKSGRTLDVSIADVTVFLRGIGEEPSWRNESMVNGLPRKTAQLNNGKVEVLGNDGNLVKVSTAVVFTKDADQVARGLLILYSPIAMVFKVSDRREVARWVTSQLDTLAKKGTTATHSNEATFHGYRFSYYGVRTTGTSVLSVERI